MGKFHLGFALQPIAHSAHLWNLLGMVLVGWGSVLLGGCPLRQLILAAQGNGDSAVTVFGMLVGAALAHNFGLAGNPEITEENADYDAFVAALTAIADTTWSAVLAQWADHRAVGTVARSFYISPGRSARPV